MRWAPAAALVALTAGFVAAKPPLPAEAGHRRLVEQFRAYIAEVGEIEARFQGRITGSAGPFADLGKMDFILSGAERYPRRYLHPDDHNFVYSAVKGQSEAELEANLPAMVNYVRLATAARMYNYRARAKQPLFGSRRGMAVVDGLAKRIYDFRKEQLAKIKSGALRPSQVLTVGNLADLGDPALYEDLLAAYRAGQEQFTNQRNSVVFVVMAVELAFSFLIAALVLRRVRPLTVITQSES